MSIVSFSFRSLWRRSFIHLFFLTPGLVFGSGPLVNDVGNGAFLWGTSGERTTYLGPYRHTKAPTIRKISEETNNADPWESGTRSRADLWKTSEEVGTVIGTDGKIYRYRYIRGVEPRRVVEPRVVSGKTEKVERIVWEPVIIRALEPMSGGEKAKADGSPAPCEPNAVLPKPCAPADDSETKIESGNSVNSGADPNVAPSPNNSAGDGEVFDPTVGKPSEGPKAIADSSTASSATSDDGVISVTVVTRDANAPTQTPRPIVAVPKNGLR